MLQSIILYCNHWKVQSLDFVIFSGILIVIMYSILFGAILEVQKKKFINIQRNLRLKFGQKGKKSLIIGLNKGSAKGLANIQGSAEPNIRCTTTFAYFNYVCPLVDWIGLFERPWFNIKRSQSVRDIVSSLIIKLE